MVCFEIGCAKCKLGLNISVFSNPIERIVCLQLERRNRLIVCLLSLLWVHALNNWFITADASS